MRSIGSHGRSTFTSAEIDELRKAVRTLYASDPTCRAQARQTLWRLGFRAEDWVHPANAFDSHQLERRIAQGSIRVSSKAVPVNGATDPGEAARVVPSGVAREAPEPFAQRENGHPANEELSLKDASDRADDVSRDVPDPHTQCFAAVLDMLTFARVRFTAHDNEHVVLHDRVVSCVPTDDESTSDVIDRVAFLVRRREMRESLVRRLPLADLDLVPSNTQYGIELHRGAEPMAEVRPTRAVLAHGTIPGPFIHSGEHWGRLTAELAGDVPRLGRIAGSPGVRLRNHFDSFPETSSAQSRELARDATEALLTRRWAAYEIPVDLLADDLHLRLLPLRRRHGRLEAPFACRISENLFAGALVLDDRFAVLPLREFAKSAPDVIDHWLTALLGLRELTCANREEHPKGRPRTPNGQPARRSARPTGPDDLHDRHFARGSQLPHGGRLVPTAETLAIASSARVVGHSRQLSTGTPSEEAVARAADLGITLGPQETWVRPHTRGLPPDAALTFVWHMPGDLFVR